MDLEAKTPGTRTPRTGSVKQRLTVSVAEAADLLGIGRSLAYEMARDGRLPTVKPGARRYVVPRMALERMLANADPAADSTHTLRRSAGAAV